LTFDRMMADRINPAVAAFFSPDNRRLVAIEAPNGATGQQAVVSRDVETGAIQPVPRLEKLALDDAVHAETLGLPDGSVLLVGPTSLVGNATADRLPGRSLQDGRSLYTQSDDGCWLLTGHAALPVFDLWDLKDAGQPRRVRRFRAGSAPVAALAFAHLTPHAWVADVQGNISRLNLQTGLVSARFSTGSVPAATTLRRGLGTSSQHLPLVRFLPRADRAIVRRTQTAGQSETVELWDLKQQKSLAALPMVSRHPAVSPNGKWLVFTNADGQLLLCDLGQGTTYALGGGPAPTPSPGDVLAFSSDGRHLVRALSGDGTSAARVDVWSPVESEQFADADKTATADLWFGAAPWPRSSAASAPSASLRADAVLVSPGVDWAAAVPSSQFNPSGVAVDPRAEWVLAVFARGGQQQVVVGQIQPEVVPPKAILTAGKILSAVWGYDTIGPLCGIVYEDRGVQFTVIRPDSGQMQVTAELSRLSASERPLVAFSDTGEKFVAAAANRVSVWDWQRGNPIGEYDLATALYLLPPDPRSLTSSSTNPTSTLVAIDLHGDELHLVWSAGEVLTLNARTGRPLRAALADVGRIAGAAFAPDGSFVLLLPAPTSTSRFSATPGPAGVVLDLASGIELGRLSTSAESSGHAVVSQSGEWAVIDHADVKLRLWHLRSGRMIHEAMANDGRFSSSRYVSARASALSGSSASSPLMLAFRADGQALASVSRQSTSQGAVHQFRWEGSDPNAASGSETGAPPNPITFLREFQFPEHVNARNRLDQAISHLAVSSDGTRAASYSSASYREGQCVIWDTETGEKLGTSSGVITGNLTFISHTSSVAVVSSLGIDRLNLTSAAKKSEIKGESLLAQDGVRAAINTHQRSQMLWVSNTLLSGALLDVTRKRPTAARPSLTGLTYEDRFFAHAANAGRLAVANNDSVKLYQAEANSYRLLQRLDARDLAGPVEISADGNRIVCAADVSAGCSFYYWDLAQGQQPRRFGPPRNGLSGLRSRSGALASLTHALAMTPNGRLVLTADDQDATRGIGGTPRSSAAAIDADATLLAWDPDTGSQLARIKGHQAAITAIAVSDDGATAVSASVDGALRVWRIGSAGRQVDVAASAPAAVSASPTAAETGSKLSPDGKPLALIEAFSLPAKIGDFKAASPAALRDKYKSDVKTADEKQVGGLASSGDGLLMTSGEHHLFVFPNRGKTHITWHGMAQIRSTIDVYAWNGSEYTRLKSTSFASRGPQTVEADAEIPTTVSELTVLVTDSNGVGLQTDALTAQPAP
jgi:WD40 repeat protein